MFYSVQNVAKEPELIKKAMAAVRGGESIGRALAERQRPTNRIDIYRLVRDAKLTMTRGEYLAFFKELEKRGLGKITVRRTSADHDRFTFSDEGWIEWMRLAFGNASEAASLSFQALPEAIAFPWGGGLGTLPTRGVSKSDVELLETMLRAIKDKLP